MLGVDTSFYVAVALTYFEFLEEKEVSRTDHTCVKAYILYLQSYLAALND